MTYNVFSGMLNPTLSINPPILYFLVFCILGLHCFDSVVWVVGRASGL